MVRQDLKSFRFLLANIQEWPQNWGYAVMSGRIVCADGQSTGATSRSNHLATLQKASSHAPPHHGFVIQASKVALALQHEIVSVLNFFRSGATILFLIVDVYFL
jgi:hypothetical protein